MISCTLYSYSHTQSFSVIVFIAALVVELKFKDLTNTQKNSITNISVSLLQKHLYARTEGFVGLVLASTLVAIVIGIIALIVRLFNLRHDTPELKVIFCLVNLYFNYI